MASCAHHQVADSCCLQPAEIAASLAYGIRTYPAFVANWLHYRVDQLVIAHLMGVGSVGIYAVSVRWAEMLWLLGYGLLNAGLFRMASGQPDELRAFTWRLFKMTLLVSGGAGVAMALLGLFLVPLLYGPAFQDAVAPLIILIPGVVLWDAARVLSNYIGYNLGRPQLPTAVALGGVVVNGLATIVVVPRFGLVGAALTSTVTYSLVMFATVTLFRRVAP